jgi:hypothetical protein
MIDDRLDETGKSIIGQGYEFTISVRGSVPNDSSLSKAENVVITAVKEIIAALLAGKII